MPAKKAAKTAAHRADPKNPESKDLRRAYEHLGRIEILQRIIDADSSKHVHTLVALAEKALAKGHRKDGADLLRAAEHLSFAALAGADGKPGTISDELKAIVADEVEHLTRKANEHWDASAEGERGSSLMAVFHNSLAAAVTALHAGAYRPALELARGAEALAHVKNHGPEELQSGRTHLKLAKP